MPASNIFIDGVTGLPPTVALNSPADAGSTADTTPDLVFTGTDSDDDDVRYEVQVHTRNNFTGRLASATDDFNRADSTSLGANWSTGVTGLSAQILSNQVAQNSAANDNLNYYSGISAIGDQYSQAVVKTVGNFTGVVVRASATDHVTFRSGSANTDAKVIWYNAGSFTQIGSTLGRGFSANDVIRLEVTVETYRAYINDILVISGTNESAPSTGRPGIQLGSSGARLDDFEGGAFEEILIDNVSGSLASGLSDDFNDNSIHGKWLTYTAVSGAVAETSGQLQLTCANTTNGSWAGIYSKDPIDFRGMYAQVESVDAVGGNTYLDLTLCLNPLPTTTNGFVSIGVDTGLGDLQAYVKINEIDQVLANVTYNATTHKYWRIRENGGFIYWEYSADATTWSELYHGKIGMEVSSVYVVLDDYEYNSSASPGAHILDNFVIGAWKGSAFVNTTGSKERLRRIDIGSYASAATHGTGSYATGAFTPPPNSLLVVAVSMMGNATTGDLGTPTISGGSLTYTLQSNAYGAASWSHRLNVFTAPVGASPSSMTITVDDDTNQDIYNYAVSVMAYVGHDSTTPITGIISSGSTDIADGAETQTLSATPTADDETLAFIAGDADTVPNATVFSGFTKIYDTGISAGTSLVVGARGGSTSTSVVVSDVYTATGTYFKGAMISLIVKASATDTDPFASADQVTYTVQAALAAATHYWRVRAKDPYGDNEWGAWSSTRSFTISGGGGGTSIKTILGVTKASVKTVTGLAIASVKTINGLA